MSSVALRQYNCSSSILTSFVRLSDILSQVVINGADIIPTVTWGTSPQDVVPINGSVPDPAALEDPQKKAAMERALEYMGLTPGTPMTDLKVKLYTPSHVLISVGNRLPHIQLHNIGVAWVCSMFRLTRYSLVPVPMLVSKICVLSPPSLRDGRLLTMSRP